MERKIAIFRKEHFNAAHRLFVPGWTDEQNLEILGNVPIRIIMAIIMN